VALEALFRDLPPEDREVMLSLLRVQMARRRRRGRPSPRMRTEKRCPRCGETKAVADFDRNRARPDGRQVYCKVCRMTP
jgi:hypothetical protein